MVDNVLVSIIVLNWNGLSLLRECLDSIVLQTHRNIEIILVDNGSQDGSVEFIKANYSRIILIENEENLGFAKGNNQGIERSKGDYIMTLNNDTYLAKECIEILVRAAESSENHIGMWAPKILSTGPEETIDSVGGLVIYNDGIAKGRGRLEMDTGQYDSLKEIIFPSACAALYRRKLLEQINGFDEDFFAYCEDTDLGLRALWAGWRAISVTEAVVYHHYSSTGGKYSPLKAYLVERNRLWVAIKDFPFNMLLLIPFYTVWRFLFQIYGALKGKGASGRFVERYSFTKLPGILFKAYIVTLRGLPLLFKKRQSILSTRKIASREFFRLIRNHSLGAKDLVFKD